MSIMRYRPDISHSCCDSSPKHKMCTTCTACFNEKDNIAHEETMLLLQEACRCNLTKQLTDNYNERCEQTSGCVNCSRGALPEAHLCWGPPCMETRLSRPSASPFPARWGRQQGRGRTSHPDPKWKQPPAPATHCHPH